MSGFVLCGFLGLFLECCWKDLVLGCRCVRVFCCWEMYWLVNWCSGWSCVGKWFWFGLGWLVLVFGWWLDLVDVVFIVVWWFINGNGFLWMWFVLEFCYEGELEFVWVFVCVLWGLVFFVFEIFVYEVDVYLLVVWLLGVIDVGVDECVGLVGCCWFVG